MPMNDCSLLSGRGPRNRVDGVHRLDRSLDAQATKKDIMSSPRVKFKKIAYINDWDDVTAQFSEIIVSWSIYDTVEIF